MKIPKKGKKTDFVYVLDGMTIIAGCVTQDESRRGKDKSQRR